MSAGPAMNTRGKAKDQLVVTMLTCFTELMKELWTIEQQSIDNEHDSEVTQGSDLEEEDNEGDVTEIEEQ